MARIRTIKPEFPKSESVGRLSRDARLLFIQLWPECDDHGRTRGASRMLASLLYPYDEDAPSLIDGWLDELIAEGCIRIYEVDGSRYLEVCNWLKHQKIDKPSKPVFPGAREASRVFESAREASRILVVGSGSGSKASASLRSAGEASSPSPPAGQEQPGHAVAQTLPPLYEAADLLEAEAPVDPVKAMFDKAVVVMAKAELDSKIARQQLGRLRKYGGDEFAARCLDAIERDSVVDPISWITKAIAAHKKREQDRNDNLSDLL